MHTAYLVHRVWSQVACAWLDSLLCTPKQSLKNVAFNEVRDLPRPRRDLPAISPKQSLKRTAFNEVRDSPIDSPAQFNNAFSHLLTPSHTFSHLLTPSPGSHRR